MEFLLVILLMAISGIYDNYETVAGDTILLDEYPADIVVGKDHRTYVLTSTAETFSILTIEDNKIIDKTKFDQDYGYPANIQIDSDNQLLYIVNSKDPSLSVYHLDSKEFIQNINFEYCPSASIQKFYFNQETNTLYFIIHGNEKSKICSNSYSTIMVIDGSTLEIIPNLTDLINIDSLFMDSKNNSILAISIFESEIKVIDGQKNIVSDSISLDEEIDHENYYDEKSNLIFGHHNGTITIIDINDSQNIKKITVPNYDDQQIRLSGGNEKLFIISDDYYTSQFSGKNGFLTMFDLEEQTFSEQIKIGQRPLYYAFDKQSSLLYTVNSQSKSISIVNTYEGHVINSTESFRFEIVSIIVIFVTIIMLIIIVKNKSISNRSWLIGGLLSVFGIYIPWSYQFYLRLEQGGSISIFDVARIQIWPFAIAMPLSFSIIYYIFLFTRYKKIGNAVSEVYYFPKRMIIKKIYEDSHLSKISFIIFAMITSFLIYEIVQQISLQDFFNSLPAAEILGILTIPEKINEGPAIRLFNSSPLLQIFLAGIGGFWLIVLRRLWNLEWNKILKFGEWDPQDKTLKEPPMKFRGSRSLVLFLYFAFFFNIYIIISQIGSESPQEWTRSTAYYSINHFLSFIVPTTLTICFFEYVVFPIFSRKKNREI